MDNEISAQKKAWANEFWAFKGYLLDHNRNIFNFFDGHLDYLSGRLVIKTGGLFYSQEQNDQLYEEYLDFLKQKEG